MEKIGLKKITEGFGSFSKGSTNKTFSYSGVDIVPLICYEVIFPGIWLHNKLKELYLLHYKKKFY